MRQSDRQLRPVAVFGGYRALWRVWSYNGRRECWEEDYEDEPSLMITYRSESQCDHAIQGFLKRTGIAA